MDCIFCKIVKGDIPSAKLFENDRILAFNDIDPKAPTHIVIIPKEHIASPAEIDSKNSAIIGEIFVVAAELAKNLKLEKGFRIVANCGEEGGQTVGHLHFHMLAGRNMGWPPG